MILNSCLRNRCFVSSLETVFRNSVVLKWCYRFFVKRCSQNRCREIGITSSLQKRCYEIGVTVSSVKRWSRKSVSPNLVTSILKTVSRNRCSVFSTKTVSRNSVIPKQCSQNGVSQNRWFRFFLKRWSRKLVLPNLVVPKRCHEIGVPVFFS